MIKITEDLYLKVFNPDEDKWVLDEINGNSKSMMISNINERLVASKKEESFSLGTAYLIVCDDNIVGYCYFSGKTKNYFYFEYLILKEYRSMGYGSYALSMLTDYAFSMCPDVAECRLNIKKSNIASMQCAIKEDFIEDDDFDPFADSFDFVKDNPYYLAKKR